MRWLFALLLIVLALPALAEGPKPGGHPRSGLARVDLAHSAIAAEGRDRGRPRPLDLTLTISQPVPYRVYFLDGPPRLVVDFREVDFSGARTGDLTGADLVPDLRWGRFRPGWSRMVVELPGPYALRRAQQVPARGGAQGALVALRIEPVDQDEFVTRGHALSALWDLPQPALDAAAAALGPADRPLRIAIDPGHGGHDPGAPSVIGGGSEKDVTLAIARQAKANIERRAREKGVPLEVRLTRDSDFFVTLGNRVRLARDWKADLFISIHADSAPNALARGASVYTLSEVASDREAARVAAKENRADLISGVDLSGENREVASILVDLGMRDSMNASADFAESLQNGMEPEGVTFRSQFHRFANFQVLRNLGVPAVLLETGFLSNDADADYLFSRKGQQAIADGIGDAVVAYLGRR